MLDTVSGFLYIVRVATRTQEKIMVKKNFHLVPKKYHHILEEVTDKHGVVEVVLKRGFEYDNGASLSCYERYDFCRADGTPSEAMLKKCIASEIQCYDKVPLDQWDRDH